MSLACLVSRHEQSAYRRRPIGRRRTSSLQVGNIALDLCTFRVSIGLRPANLAYMEFELLRLQADSPDRVASFASFCDFMWGTQGSPGRFSAQGCAVGHQALTLSGEGNCRLVAGEPEIEPKAIVKPPASVGPTRSRYLEVSACVQAGVCRWTRLNDSSFRLFASSADTYQPVLDKATGAWRTVNNLEMLKDA